MIKIGYRYIDLFSVLRGVDFIEIDGCLLSGGLDYCGKIGKIEMLMKA